MKIIRRISEDEMVAVFLRGEIYSTRFGPVLRELLEQDGVDRSIVGSPDLTD